MKALEILKEIRNIENDYDHLKTHKLDEAIKKLEELQNNISTVIEEIDYALAKPDYANVYLNNALRFLKEE